MINSLGCLLLHATGVNRAMSSLQSGLVYKYTITFTAERPALPWALGWRSRLGLVPQPCVGRALLLGCCKPSVQLWMCICVCMCWDSRSTAPSTAPGKCPAGDAPLEKPLGDAPTSPRSIPKSTWSLLHCWVRSSSRRQSPVGALQQTDHIQSPAGSALCQPTCQHEQGIEVTGIIYSSSELSFKEIMFHLKKNKVPINVK